MALGIICEDNEGCPEAEQVDDSLSSSFPKTGRGAEIAIARDGDGRLERSGGDDVALCDGTCSWFGVLVTRR